MNCPTCNGTGRGMFGGNCGGCGGKGQLDNSHVFAWLVVGAFVVFMVILVLVAG
jgi:DnaJ-class molecular chaperone